jgi:hypothetical protein
VAAAVHESRAKRRDISKFLAQHEACASEFEIRRTSDDDGEKGRLKLECGGCGELAAYDVSEPGVLEQVAKPAAGREPPQRVSREQLERWLPAPPALPWWVPNAYIVAIIGVGLALVAFGLFAPRDEDDPVFIGNPDVTVPPQAPAEQPPAPPGAVVGAGAVAPGDSDADRQDGAEWGRPRNAPGLDSVTVLDRFSIGIPAGWLRGLEDGAVMFTTPEREATVRVYLESGESPPGRFSDRAADYLEDQHPKAEISEPERFRLGGEDAVHLVASWDGGTEHAALLSDSGHSYLLLSRIDEEASKTTRKGAIAALHSFRAL